MLFILHQCIPQCSFRNMTHSVLTTSVYDHLFIADNNPNISIKNCFLINKCNIIPYGGKVYIAQIESDKATCNIRHDIKECQSFLSVSWSDPNLVFSAFLTSGLMFSC